jgi:hypothetical protein
MIAPRVSEHAIDRYIERVGPLANRQAVHDEIVRCVSRAMVCGLRMGSRFKIILHGINFVVEDGCVVTTIPADRHPSRRRGRRHYARQSVEVEV